MYGAIEAGGTKFVCAVSDDKLNIIEKITISTREPEETFQEVFDFFDRFQLKSLGIGSFGPIGVNKNKSNYGQITTTTKKLWRNVNFLDTMRARYNIPIGWDTDVNAAALGEATFGAAKDKGSCVYLTVGTGIGGGLIIDGQPVNGFNHSEMGHFFVPKHPKDTFEGICDYHSNCLEGLASGPAIEKRLGIKAEKLPENDIGWEFESYYISQALIAISMIINPECIILGGGVMQQKHLIELIREDFKGLLNGYLDLPPVEEYILPTGLDQESGILGSLILAKDFAK